MYSIGEFSKITGLSVKTLRFYHQTGLLCPHFIDPQSGYRYYHPRQIAPARAIAWLRRMEFPLEEIQALLRPGADDLALLEAMEKQRDTLASRIAAYRRIVRQLRQFIQDEREALTMAERQSDVEEKELSPITIAGIRMRGRYSDCGKAFGRLCRRFGRAAGGKPMLLHYDADYHEENADFEACLPLRRPADAEEDVSVRTLPGGRCITLLHHGPYEQLGQSYARILAYVQQHGYQVLMPTREVYLKGPGMIFRGNAKHYLTEIQMLVASAGQS